MRERECDLGIFAGVISDEFVNDTRRWFDDIPDMPEPGHGRFEASNTYERIVEAFIKTPKEQRQLTPQDVTQIFDADKELIVKRRNDPSFDPSLDYSLNNVLAIDEWYQREEFEKEEGSTPRYHALHQVNGLIRQTIDLANSAQASASFRK